MDVQGWVVIGVALLLFGYLLPHLVSTRQQLAESRVEDRFSTALRVVATGTPTRESSPAEHHGASGSRPYLHDPRRRTEGPAVKRPTTAGERAATEARRLAAARAARAAEISRRQAAARRRLVLTLVLLVASTGGWVAFGAASMSIALGLVPTVLLAAVLVAGRRAAKIAARRNAADRAAMARLELRPEVRTRPAVTEQTALAAEEHTERAAGAAQGPAATVEETATDEERAGAADDEPAERSRGPQRERGGEWVPVPVPAPAYTLKPRAPRRDVAPYTAPEAPAAAPATVVTPSAPSTAPAAASAPRTSAASARSAPSPAAAVEASGLAGSPYGPVALTDAELQAEVAPLPEPAASGGMDLDSVLARRRAVGA